MYHSRNMQLSRFSTILGIIFTAIVGTLLHFVFKWSMDHPAVALFAAVNESTWEHLKLLFFPVILYTIFEYASQGRYIPGYLYARSLALCTGLAFIITAFYTYSGILGRNYFLIDIGVFLASVVLTFILTIKIQKWRRMLPTLTWIALLIFLILAAAFFVFTFYPPHIGLFMDPQAGDYGILAVFQYI